MKITLTGHRPDCFKSPDAHNASDQAADGSSHPPASPRQIALGFLKLKLHPTRQRQLLAHLPSATASSRTDEPHDTTQPSTPLQTTATAPPSNDSQGLNRQQTTDLQKPSSTFLTLPPDAQELISKQLDDGNLSNFRRASSQIRNVLHPDFQARREMQAPANIVRQALSVINLQQFSALLGQPEQANGPNTVARLPSQQRAEALTVLGYRITALPEAEKADAIGQFLTSFASIPPHERTDRLSALEQAARTSPTAITELQEITSKVAVRAGGNVQQVAAQHGITNHDELHNLERFACLYGPAAAEVAAGGHLIKICARYGIHKNRFLEKLMMVSVIHGPAGRAIRAGEDVDEITAKFGLIKEPFYNAAPIWPLYAGQFQP